MSKNFLTPIGIFTAGTDPISASTGDIYFNSSSNVTRVYYGSGWVNLSASSTLATHANTASAISGTLVTGIVASATVATTSGHANTASAINALLLTGTTFPAAIVSSSLTGVGTLANLTVTNTISGRAASATVSTHAGTASSIAGSLVTGYVASANVATHAGTASSIAGSLVTGTVASATISASSTVAASIDAGGITSGILSVSRGGTGVTNSVGSGSVVLTNSPVWTTGNMFTGVINTTISATAGVYGFSVSPGTTLTGCVITNRSAGTVNRVHSSQVNVALNGTTASNGFVRGYAETNGGAAVAAAGNVFGYYIAF